MASLVDRHDGFAISTSALVLATVLPLFTREYRVCAWVKPIGASGTTRGIHNTWEPLIVVPGRELRPGKRDWLAADLELVEKDAGLSADGAIVGCERAAGLREEKQSGKRFRPGGRAT